VTHWLGLTIESLVALLLVLTIGYCVVLNRRLKCLRTDEHAMREMIAELVAATDTAERAIGALRQAAQECDQTLGERLRAAERVTAALEQQLGSGERLVAGAPGMTTALRPAAPPPPPDAKAVVAAAQAFAERARLRVFGQAA